MSGLRLAGGGLTSSQVAAGNLGSSKTVTLATPIAEVTGTLNANCALTLAGLVAGTSAVLLLSQDGTGNWTLTINGSSVSVPGTASGSFAISVYSPDGSALYIVPPGVTSPGGAIVGTTATQTLTNKRNTRRVGTVTQAAAPAINTDNMDVASITGLAQAITSMTTNLTGTPVDGDMLIIRLTDNGTARAITWGASFEASTIALPTTTVLSTLLLVGFAWNTATSKWRCVAAA